MTLLYVGLIGGFVGLDATSAPQIMLSRPLVAASLTGAVLGRPVEGLLIGAVLEAFALVILPIGAARYPESGTAAVAATAAYAVAAGPGLVPSMALMAVVFGLVWETVSGATVTRCRMWNERVLREAEGPPGALARTVERRHLTAMLVDFARGAVVCVVGSLVGHGVLRLLGPMWRVPDGAALGAMALSATIMVAAALSLFGGWRERRLAFTLGILCGFLLALVR